MRTLAEHFTALRNASTPLACIRSADPAATISCLRKSFNGDAPPLILWDIVRGIKAINKAGEEALGNTPEGTEVPVNALIFCATLPAKSNVFFLGAHRVIQELGVSQAIWNLRDRFKGDRRMLVLMCPSVELPVEIQQDVTVIDEPLPDEDHLDSIIQTIYRGAKLPMPADRTKAVEAVSGLAAFPAEQACAEAMRKDGIDVDDLWERKRQVIEQTRGLTVWRGRETFEDIRGCQNAIDYFSRMMNGENPPRAVIWWDECEKAMAGATTDTSGVKGELTGGLLTWMNDHENLQAVMLIGSPGCTKSMLAKCTGGTYGKPTIAFDLGAMQNSLVGESGANMRQAFKVIDAISQGYILMIATCNSFGTLSPEMKRRFKSATFFCDLPTDEEKKAIWSLYAAKYKLKKQPLPNDRGWTGAEIKNCCETAWRFRISIKDAGQYIVPVAKSSPEVIDRLRDQAHGKFISASHAGVYQKEREENGSRVLEMEA
jgi:hypothetical protein